MDFHVSSFWLEIAILGTKFDISGVNMGKMLKIKYFDPKKHTIAWFRAFWAIMRQNRSKGLISARASKKIKKSQESDISPICPEVLRERIFTKLGTNVPLVEVMNCDKFWDSLFEGFKFYRRSKFQFPIGIWRRRYNSAALLRSLWLNTWYLHHKQSCGAWRHDGWTNQRKHCWWRRFSKQTSE